MDKIKILYFGALSEVAGKQEEEIRVSGNINDLLQSLKDKYPSLKDFQFSVAVNQEISSGVKLLSDGDEVALLPPFTGG